MFNWTDKIRCYVCLLRSVVYSAIYCIVMLVIPLTNNIHTVV